MTELWVCGMGFTKKQQKKNRNFYIRVNFEIGDKFRAYCLTSELYLLFLVSITIDGKYIEIGKIYFNLI